jgi:tetratricopeptide (TPR) repeat protein
MRTALLTLAAAPLFLAALPVQAQSRAGDPVASAAIFRGDYAEAERMLMSELRIYPERPELLLNLAAVYAQTGRTAKAQDLYRHVLARRAVMLDLPSSEAVSSHAVATAGLQRITTRAQLTSR